MINYHILEKMLKENISGIKVESITPVAGGDINRAFRIDTNSGILFMKVNFCDKFPNMLKLEMDNLNFLLKHASLLRIPKPLACFEDNTYQFLVMEYISRGTKSENFWHTFAEGLAQMHLVTCDRFGFYYDNYMGSIPQKNSWKNNWCDFFVHQRLFPQLELAHQNKLIDAIYLKKFEKLFTKLNEILPEEKPALVHGDLWGGNYFPDEKGNPVIYDPACYFGNREVDIAMTKLFGGFSSEFYEAYNYFCPLQKGWQNRIDILNLYPLLIHVNLFGKAYVYQVESIVNRYV